MNQQDILRALDECESTIRSHIPLAKPARAPRSVTNHSESVAVSHMLWMIIETRDFVAESRIEKAFRWLGFIQGVLWSFGFVTIDNAKDTNRPR
mgnify:CR=1 FL=1